MALAAAVGAGQTEPHREQSAAKRQRRERQATATAPTENNQRRPTLRTHPLVTPALRSYRIRMRPTAAQRRELRHWFECGRYAYNAMVRAIGAGDVSPATRRHAVQVVSAAERETLHRRFASVHSTIARESMYLAVQAFNAGTAKQHVARALGRPVRPFRLRERSLRRCRSEVLPLEAAQPKSDRKASADMKAVRRVAPAAPGPGLMGRRRHADVVFAKGLAALGPVRIVDSGRVIDRLVADGCLRHGGKLCWNHHTDTFHLIVCWPVDDDVLRRRIDRRPVAEHRVVALDPGARHFQTWYDPNGAHGELLAGTLPVLEERMARIDRLQQRRRDVRRPPPPPTPVESAEERLARRRRWQRVRRERRDVHRRACERMRGWMRHAHYDAVGFLTRQWDVVVASDVRFSRLMRRDDRTVGRRTVRQLRGWSHYAFHERLASAAQTRGVLVVRTPELGTSRTCGACGAWKDDLGGSETFRCGACGLVLHRDVNGARNNLLCALTIALRD